MDLSIGARYAIQTENTADTEARSAARPGHESTGSPTHSGDAGRRPGEAEPRLSRMVAEVSAHQEAPQFDAEAHEMKKIRGCEWWKFRGGNGWLQLGPVSFIHFTWTSGEMAYEIHLLNHRISLYRKDL